MDAAVPLSEILAQVTSVSHPANVGVTGLTHDSRLVKSGDLFVCLKGAGFDGHRFASDALSAGAAAVVVQANGLEAAGVSLPADAVIVTVPDTRRALPELARALYGDPSQSMMMVGVTGTNGKTTTVRMIASMLRAAGRRVGTIGTLGAELDGEPFPSEHTTPEADQLQQLLAQMRDRGATAVVMEVSSHALAQHRTDGIAFNAAVFTNLTQDHLDYHQTLEEYFEAKALLFTQYPILYPRRDGALFVAVLNVGQWEGRDLVTRGRGDIITYSATRFPAVLVAENVQLTADGTEFTAKYDSGVERYSLPIRLPFGGSFQVANALGAIGAALRLGISRESVVQGLAAMPPVPGRFEPVATGDRGFGVIVDYAHSPDGLENLLRAARELSPARTILVFGCGGNRDRGKRPIMGRIGSGGADVVIVTSDNPRNEDPDAIISDIVEGLASSPHEASAEVIIEPDRRSAIARALELARPSDLVLIAGKGHEDYQIIGDKRLPFDDRAVVRELLELGSA